MDEKDMVCATAATEKFETINKTKQKSKELASCYRRMKYSKNWGVKVSPVWWKTIT